MERGLAHVLAALRDEQGMTQSDLAAKSKVSRSMVSEILDGKRSMTMTEFELMCRALGVTMSQVIRSAESAPPPPASGTESRTG